MTVGITGLGNIGLVHADRLLELGRWDTGVRCW